MYELLMILYVLVSAAIIGLVLIQHGKGADMGASFGAGASATIFGSAGKGNFMTKSTTILAVVFFALSLLIGNYNTTEIEKKAEFDNLGTVTTEQAPADKAAAEKAVVEETPKKEETTKDIPVGN
ncbi:MAG: preprotein translocase subunit SecG [Gammaproteobacteria bacterium]|nr:preprotein translocase subunit SecG [Gammaproteobacteria bacterium]